MPSRHEGFCIPIIEAQAAGLPVVAARAGALPETVGNAGLTFAPDDAEDLARQVRRVLEVERPIPLLPNEAAEKGKHSSDGAIASDGRVAIVSYRYGTDIVGGAETSLRIIAETLAAAGHYVEVFTTSARGEAGCDDHYPKGTTAIAGIPVHRFPLDPRDPERYWAAVHAATRNPAHRETHEDLLRHSVRSERLLESLRQRLKSFDAVIVGPYGVGLTYEIARAFPEKTLLLPCFHDEPLARLSAWPQAYGQVGGILYHSLEEQELAESELGINHPRSLCCGTVLDSTAMGDGDRGQAVVGTIQPYVVYCGRYSEEKELPALLDSARKYYAHTSKSLHVRVPGHGNGNPERAVARNLGFVDEQTRRDVMRSGGTRAISQ